MSTAEVTVQPRLEWIKKLGVAIGIGGGPTLLVEEAMRRGLITAVTINQLIGVWGPAGLILVGLYMAIEKWMPRVVSAQTKLANSVEKLAERGDRDARETIGMVRYTFDEVQRVHNKTMARFDEMHRAMVTPAQIETLMASVRDEIRQIGAKDGTA